MSVQIRELTARTDPRGASFDVAVPFAAAGECHIATIRPGHVRGNHFHTTRHELLVVVATGRWTLFWDEGEGTPVQQRTFEAGAVEMQFPPLEAHAVRNDGGSDLHLFVLGDVRADDAQRRVLAQPLTRIAGVDGVRGGWVAVVKDGASVETRTCMTAGELLALIESCAIVAIDVPIGLVEQGHRACDHHARKFLRNKSSVFTAPIRPILRAATPSEAQAIARSLQEGHGLPYTTVALRDAVAQVDELLQRHHELRERVYEVHPEVSFAHWSQGAALASKRSPEGRDARRALVRAHFGEVPPPPRGAREDDLLDAFAALWTAERIASGHSQSLGDGHPDLTGLPMRIVY